MFGAVATAYLLLRPPFTALKLRRQPGLGARAVAGLPEHGVHILRHTFCSHLAMRGAPARAIQELAGHADLTTTQRYMHLSPAATEEAIRLLEGPAKAGHYDYTGVERREKSGDILDTRSPKTGSD